MCWFLTPLGVGAAIFRSIEPNTKDLADLCAAELDRAGPVRELGLCGDSVGVVEVAPDTPSPRRSLGRSLWTFPALGTTRTQDPEGASRGLDRPRGPGGGQLSPATACRASVTTRRAETAPSAEVEPPILPVNLSRGFRTDPCGDVRRDSSAVSTSRHQVTQ